MMTSRVYFDSKNENDTNKEQEATSPGKELLKDIENRLQKDIVSINHNGHFL